MKNRPIAWHPTLAGAALAVMVGLPAGAGHADMFEGFPDVIVLPLVFKHIS